MPSIRRASSSGMARTSRIGISASREQALPILCPSRTARKIGTLTRPRREISMAPA
jgi:hypothetical protein